MAENVVALNSARQSVTFSVEITQHGDGSFDVALCDVADDPQNLQAVLAGLKRIVSHIEGATDGHS